jgi:hypothetical protein
MLNLEELSDEQKQQLQHILKSREETAKDTG